MPYCPKCDMEFVDGITVCSDCGGPLIPTEEYETLKEAENEKRLAMFMGGGMEEEELSDPSSAIPEESEEKETKSRAASHAYVSKRARFEDMRSSVSAFLMVGGIFLVFSALLWTGIVKLPMNPGSGLFFRCVLTLLAIGCLIVAAVTHRSGASLQKGAAEEEALTEELINWFASSYSAGELDRILKSEDPSLEGNELELKRFELIQDQLITSRDLPNPDYVDFLCEEIYGRLFEKQ